MPSPFPGMDPYLEDPAFWEGFHHLFMVECCYQLSSRLPGNYLAHLQVRQFRIKGADPAVEQYVPCWRSHGLLTPEWLDVREGYVEIVQLPHETSVTTVELISLSSKFGSGIDAHVARRRARLTDGTQCVEIDLLRHGFRMPLPQAVKSDDYRATVCLPRPASQVCVYSWGLRDGLPVIQIPLRQPESEVPLDLAALVSSVYDGGRYEKMLRYKAGPPGPLSPEDERWAAEIARRARLER